MSKLALMFHAKFHCIKTINVRNKNIVQMGPLIAKIKNNISILSNSVIRDKKNVSRGNIYVRTENWCKVECAKSAIMRRKVSEV